MAKRETAVDPHARSTRSSARRAREIALLESKQQQAAAIVTADAGRHPRR